MRHCVERYKIVKKAQRVWLHDMTSTPKQRRQREALRKRLKEQRKLKEQSLN
jgi:hypothetical protein